MANDRVYYYVYVEATKKDGTKYQKLVPAKRGERAQAVKITIKKDGRKEQFNQSEQAKFNAIKTTLLTIEKRKLSNRAPQTKYNIQKATVLTDKEISYLAKLHEPFTGSDTQKEHFEGTKGFSESLKNEMANLERKLSQKVDRFNAPFEVNEELLNQGITEEMQMEYYNLMVAANRRGEEIAIETDSVITPRFSQRMDNLTLDQYIRRMQAASHVMEDDYVSFMAKMYKDDYVDAIKQYIEPYLWKKIEEVFNSISDTQFFNILKARGRDFTAYALDSLITDFGMEYVLQEALTMVSDIKATTSVK